MLWRDIAPTEICWGQHFKSQCAPWRRLYGRWFGENFERSKEGNWPTTLKPIFGISNDYFARCKSSDLAYGTQVGACGGGRHYFHCHFLHSLWGLKVPKLSSAAFFDFCPFETFDFCLSFVRCLTHFFVDQDNMFSQNPVHWVKKQSPKKFDSWLIPLGISLQWHSKYLRSATHSCSAPIWVSLILAVLAAGASLCFLEVEGIWRKVSKKDIVHPKKWCDTTSRNFRDVLLHNISLLIFLNFLSLVSGTPSPTESSPRQVAIIVPGAAFGAVLAYQVQDSNGPVAVVCFFCFFSCCLNDVVENYLEWRIPL